MLKTSHNGDKLKKIVYEKYLNDELTAGDLVQLTILLFEFLNLKTIAKFAKENNKTYKGVKDYNKNIININGNIFIYDLN